MTAGYFHFSNHFRGVDLVQARFFFDYNPDGGAAFRMGLAQAVTAVLGLLLLWIKGRNRRHLFIAVSLLVATVMITPLSRWLWQWLPLLPFTQFPWRFLSVQAFAGALAAAGLARLPGRRLVVSATIALLLAAGLGDLKTDHLALTNADITAEKLVQYEWFTGNIGTTISAEYLPHTVQPRPYTSAWLATGRRDTVRALTGSLLAAQRSGARMTRQTWQIETAVPATLVFPTLHWPGWIGEIDGARTAIRPSPGSGLIMLDVPAGAHTVTLRLGRAPVRLAAELTSLTAVLLTLWLSCRTENGAWQVKRITLRSPVVIGLLLLAVLAIGLRFWPARALPDDDLTWDFGQMGYLHHDGRIPFSDGAVLAGYTYSSEEVVTGETLTIALDWQAGAPGAAALALVTPAQHRNRQAPLLTWQSGPVQAGTVAYHLAIPANAPPGLYAPRLTLADGRPLTPSGKGRGDLFLRPLRIIQPAIADPQPPADSLAVRPVRIEARDDRALDVQLAWLTPQPLSHNYNFSLRLLDGDGAIFSQFDGQPGYGFLPSSGWPAGEWVHDWLALPLSTPPPATSHSLVVHLYDAASGDVVLTRRLGEWDRSKTFRAQTPVFESPEGIVAAAAVFMTDDKPIIQLEGYAHEAAVFTLYWRALETIPTNYTRFIHLVDPVSGQIVAQVDGYPRGDSYPTSQWTSGEIVADAVRLHPDDLPAGEYEIVIGFYENLGERLPHLTAVAPDGRPFTDDRVPLASCQKNQGNRLLCR